MYKKSYKEEFTKPITYVVNAKKLRVRAAPSKDGEVRTVVTEGTRLILGGNKAPEGWIPVMVPTHRITGWVMKEFVEEVKDE